MMKLTGFFFLTLLVSTSMAHAKNKNLNIDTRQITVSGLSAGGFMAVQFHLAHSDLIRGAAIFAGGIFGCAEGNLGKALGQCMDSPQTIAPQNYIQMAKTLSKSGEIANLENLKNQRVFLFSGELDTKVRPLATKKLSQFYQHFLPPENILKNSELAAEHGLPTLDFGSPCRSGGQPWLLNCGFDGAGIALNHLYGKLNNRTKSNPSNLIHFDQSRFEEANSSMATDGSVYIPNSCNKGNSCALHVVFHGCRQGREFMGDEFALHSGFNEWAEANNIVILYPTVLSSDFNPKGCWDWWGYSGNDYLTQRGAQIKTVQKIIKSF